MQRKLYLTDLFIQLFLFIPTSRIMSNKFRVSVLLTFLQYNVVWKSHTYPVVVTVFWEFN